MIVSTSNKSASGEGSYLTPALVRGLFIIWQNELKRGNEVTEIREFDSYTSVTGSFAGRAFGVPEDTAGYEAGIDSTNGRLNLSDTDSW
jgi:hypothetical protein